jgi:hypothetical protein
MFTMRDFQKSLLCEGEVKRKMFWCFFKNGLVFSSSILQSRQNDCGARTARQRINDFFLRMKTPSNHPNESAALRRLVERFDAHKIKMNRISFLFCFDLNETSFFLNRNGLGTQVSFFLILKKGVPGFLI